MYIFYLSNEKKRMFLYSLMILFWVLTFVFLSNALQDRVFATLKIDNEFSLSYPIKFNVTQTWQDKSFGKVAINAMSNFADVPYKDFYSRKAGISFKYPAIFNAEEKNFPGGEILYHVDLLSKDLANHGFVEVWRLSMPMEKFLESSLSTSNQQFINFTQKNITSNGMNGVLWDYSVKGHDGKQYKSLEAFLSNDGKMYRVSLFMPAEKYTQANYDMFMKMVNSLKPLK